MSVIAVFVNSEWIGNYDRVPSGGRAMRIYTEHGVHLQEQTPTAIAGGTEYGMTASRPSAVRSDDASPEQSQAAWITHTCISGHRTQ
jgi:hypothetical protein